MIDSGLTEGRITYAGTAGQLTDSAGLVFNGMNVGIGTASPSQRLDVFGNVNLGNAVDAALMYNSAISSGGSALVVQPSSANNTAVVSVRPSGSSTIPPALELIDTSTAINGTTHRFNFGTGYYFNYSIIYQKCAR